MVFHHCAVCECVLQKLCLSFQQHQEGGPLGGGKAMRHCSIHDINTHIDELCSNLKDDFSSIFFLCVLPEHALLPNKDVVQRP